MSRKPFRQGPIPRGCSALLRLVACPIIVASLSFPALAQEVVVAQTALTFSVGEDWLAEIEESTTPAGRLVQRWVHEPISYLARRYKPEITAWAVPIEEAADLLVLTQDTLAEAAFATTLGSVECLKCVTAILPRPGAVWFPRRGPTKAFVTALSFEDWPDCEVGGLADYHGTCLSQSVNSVGLSIEPSWVFRFHTDGSAGPLEVVLINLIVEERLVVISFRYLPAMRHRLNDEIFAIIKSIRLLDEPVG